MDFVQFTDKIDIVGIDPVLTETVQLLGEQAALTIDTLIRDVLTTTGTNVQYATGVAGRVNVSSAMILNGTEIKKAVRTLRRNNAQPLEDGAYVGIIGPDAEYDLMSDTMWVDVSKYQDKEKIYKGEIGKLYGVKFVRTSNAKKFAGAGAAGADVHATLILGKNAYGVVDIAGGVKPETIIKPHGSSGTNDPLNQTATAGWKAMFTSKILNDAAMVRIEHGATA